MTDQQPQTAQQPQSLISFNTTAPDAMQQAPMQQTPMQQTPKPPANPYQAIIEQQKAQIDALMQQNGALSGQISQMVQNGYQVQQAQQPQQQSQQPQQAPYVGQNWAMQPENVQYPPIYEGGVQQAPMSLTQDVSLESLASEIGKKEG